MTQTSLALSASTRFEHQFAGPRIAFTAAALMLNILVLITVTIAAIASGHQPDLFFAEGSVITIWSSLQMVAICAMCLWLFQLRRSANQFTTRRSSALWLLAAIGAGVLSIDEAAGLHESIDHQIHAVFEITENPWTDRLDDAIVLGYGMVALAVAYVCRTEFRLLRSAKNVFVIAFGLFIVMVAIDLLTNSYSVKPFDQAQLARFDALRAWGVVIEDSFKLTSEGVFIAALAMTAATFKRTVDSDQQGR
jgi:Ca2+/Na+ antiporter